MHLPTVVQATKTAMQNFAEGKSWLWQWWREDMAFPRPSVHAGLHSLHQPRRDVGSTAPPYSSSDVLGQWWGPNGAAASPATGPQPPPCPLPAWGALPAHGSADVAGSQPAGVTKRSLPHISAFDLNNPNKGIKQPKPTDFFKASI